MIVLLTVITSIKIIKHCWSFISKLVLLLDPEEIHGRSRALAQMVCIKLKKVGF